MTERTPTWGSLGRPFREGTPPPPPPMCQLCAAHKHLPRTLTEFWSLGCLQPPGRDRHTNNGDKELKGEDRSLPGNKGGLREEGVGPTWAVMEKPHRGTEGRMLLLHLEPGRVEPGRCCRQRDSMSQSMSRAAWGQGPSSKALQPSMRGLENRGECEGEHKRRQSLAQIVKVLDARTRN